jgi:hypothetical protein
MQALFALCVLTVALWAALAGMALVLTPGESPLDMDLRGRLDGRASWLVKATFAVRGAAALLLAGAVAVGTPATARLAAGLVLFALWGAGSALLAVLDADLPGDPPSATGRAHVQIAHAAYVAAVAGMLMMSLNFGQAEEEVRNERIALPVALLAAVVMVLHFAGHWQAARGPAGVLARSSGILQNVCLVLVMIWTAAVAIAL